MFSKIVRIQLTTTFVVMFQPPVHMVEDQMAVTGQKIRL